VPKPNCLRLFFAGSWVATINVTSHTYSIYIENFLFIHNSITTLKLTLQNHQKELESSAGDNVQPCSTPFHFY